MVTILGKRWRFRFTPFAAPKGKRPHHGECDHPEKKRKEIRINSDLRGRARLEAIIHECRHAASWHVDEEFIEREAHDLARILWDLGYRLPTDED